MLMSSACSKLQQRLTFSTRRSFDCLQWPLLPGGDEPQPPNAELRLYGGAAFERAVAEFQEAARLLAMPPGAGSKPLKGC